MGTDVAPSDSEPIWAAALHHKLRTSDLALVQSCQDLLKEYEEELLVIDSVQEMLDVVGV